MFDFLKDGKGGGGKGRLILLVLGGLAGVFLIVFGGSFGKVTTEEVHSTYQTREDELVIYQEYLEKRVRELCEPVVGSSVTVTVTLSESFSSVYATEWDKEEEKYVILGSGSSASALYLTRSAPQIGGIGIVCRGGGDATLRKELLALLSSAFHVPSNRIYIAEGNP